MGSTIAFGIQILSSQEQNKTKINMIYALNWVSHAALNWVSHAFQKAFLKTFKLYKNETLCQV